MYVKSEAQIIRAYLPPLCMLKAVLLNCTSLPTPTLYVKSCAQIIQLNLSLQCTIKADMGQLYTTKLA